MSLATVQSLILRPNADRTVVRPFDPGDPDPAFRPSQEQTRAQRIAQRALSMSEAELASEREFITRALNRHPDPEAWLLRRFDELEGLGIDKAACSEVQKLVIGGYFSEEYSFESAALFNPSVVRHYDQSGVADGDTRFILSLRGIGEGHLSSLTYRTGVWKKDGSVEVDEPSDRAFGPEVDRQTLPDDELLVRLSCEHCNDISEMVIFPFMPSQGRGIEDVRLVEFTDGDGRTTYRGTFTAFNGQDVRQGLLQTSDFFNYEMRGVKGELYQSKGMALFPRMVNGRYLMLGRQDNENIWLIESGDLFAWNGGKRIIEPKYAWESIQIGNCGSPIELDEGWLVITHGVGTVRNYCIGAVLLDKDDPAKVLGRLRHPLLEPDDKMRDGYVPNVVYSCGSLLRGRTLLLPYGVADNFATFATVEVDALLKAME